MAAAMSHVLVIGASGSIGRHIVAEAQRAGLQTRALVRDPAHASLFPDDVTPAGTVEHHSRSVLHALSGRLVR